MIKCKAWKGHGLVGAWQVLRKLDGVRALSVAAHVAGQWRVVSKQGKPLFNLDQHARRFTDVEVWLGSWEKTVSAVRRSARPVRVPFTALYALDPPDPRLKLGTLVNPSAQEIRAELRRYKAPGEDGLVLRQGDRWLKVKHEATYDVEVTGVQPGTGKHRGRMGALLTTKGKVGTGFTDAQRVEFASSRRAIVGEVIEVACNELTPGGKFKHARFVRVREDK